MRNKTSLFGTNKGLFSILIAILVVASFLGIPGNSKGYAGETGELHFCILHTNDMHSALIPHSPAVDYRPDKEDPTIGGFARLATAVAGIRENKMREGEPVLLFDAGDFLGGAPFAWLALRGYAAELTIMQKIGYDAVAIGNHEYDYGPDVLAQYLVQAGYPEAHEKTLVLASNTEAPADHPLAAQSLYRKTGMFELENGLKVGVFGLIGKDAVRSTGDTGNVQFLDQHEVARQVVDELKEQGADIIVAISHSGVDEDQELARNVPGIDVIVGGHSHTALYKPALRGNTIIAQAGWSGTYLGQLELAYNPNTSKVRVRNEENSHPFLTPIDDSFSPDPEIDALVQEYTLALNAYIDETTDGRFDDIMSTVARSDFVLSNEPPSSETPLGNFVADAMRVVTQEVIGIRVDIAGQASGNIRKSIFPGTAEYSGENISLYEIIEATSIGHGLDGYPGCPIVSVYLTGEEVRRLLEVNILAQRFMGDSAFLQFSGLRYSYNPANAVLFTIPFINLPIPTTRAVTRAEIYTGEGIQPVKSEGYVPLKRGDERLYHLVTDGYVLLCLPLVKDILPQIEIVPKNADGEPVPPERFDQLIVRESDGTELKVWEAVVSYAASQLAEPEEVPRIPDYYEGVVGRINKTWTFPLLAWVILILVVIVAGIAFLVWRRRKRKRAVT
ncbi:MAG: 5'-nucleotidase C-terminal domain-containing protein [Chloroflexi bacterium]|nr:5'-nucleotidase C-terminal domain-containing protein [Chloroflexota bacterium]